MAINKCIKHSGKSTKYLNLLQQRYKWKILKESVKLNDLVIIRGEILSSLHRKLGKIT